MSTKTTALDFCKSRKHPVLRFASIGHPSGIDLALLDETEVGFEWHDLSGLVRPRWRNRTRSATVYGSMEWVLDKNANHVCEVGLLRLVAYQSPTTREPCYRIAAKREGSWDALVWGSSRSLSAAKEDAQTVAREVVLRGLLADDGSTDAMLTRLALFAPVTGAELELLVRRTREWAAATCREVAENEIVRVADAVASMAEKTITSEVRREVARARLDIVSTRYNWRWWAELAAHVGFIAAAVAWLVMS